MVIIACVLCALLGIGVIYYEEGTLDMAQKNGMPLILVAGIYGAFYMVAYGFTGLCVMGAPLFLLWLLVTGLVKDYQHVTKPYKTE